MGEHGRRTFRWLLTSAAALIGAAVAAPGFAAGRCEDLARLALPDTTITRAEPVAAGAYVAPDRTRRPDLPGFCRVVAEVKSAPDSDILVEVWLPQDRWAGVFHGNGNGGYAGLLAAGYPGMEAGLKRGYATATTDMGTAPATPLNGDPLIGHPRRWKDWGKLSTHVMTATGKAIARAYYGQEVRRSYYTGCSTGGQQGLIEAMYYPEDYDGVLIGAPVVNRTFGHLAAVWDWRAANLEPGQVLSNAKLALLNRGAVAACGREGNGLVGDPFIADPSVCRFDPQVLACVPGADTAACLTPGEVATARAFYAGPTDRAGKPVYYGWARGSETPGGLGWSLLQTPPGGQPAFDGLFKWVFGADWDWKAFDLDRDMPRVDAALGGDLNGAVTGDLTRFRARGGKLIIYQGWADSLVSPFQTLDLYRRANGTGSDFARLFLAPGVMHCGGGPGPGVFNSANGGTAGVVSATARDDLFVALSHWVEDGAAPAKVIATRYVDGVPAKGVAMQRPLCAYPNKAWFMGGDRNAAGSFVCAVKRPKGEAGRDRSGS
jgi:hypothetical protein